MSRAVVTGTRPPHRGTTLRLLTIVTELGLAVGICLAGYYLAAGWFSRTEAAATVTVLRWFGVDVSSAIPGSILIFRPEGDVLEGVVTLSCSSLLSVVGLTALTAVVLRGRRLHAVAGLLAAVVAVVVANGIRLALSALAGYAWGGPAMTLFHDWVGTLWALVSTLAGFLLMVYLTLPAAERAEQDVAGRHTARRPESWARPGLGYRAEGVAKPVRRGRFSPTSFLHRRVLPRWASRRLAAHREQGRIDYRIGHQPVDERIATVRRLADDGLRAHIASLVAVATYDDDDRVLDALAEAVAARQWEPVVNEQVASLRLWARGWFLARRHTAAQLVEAPVVEAAADSTDTETTVTFDPVDDDAGTPSVRAQGVRPPVPRPVPRAPAPRPRVVRTVPHSFARTDLEDVR
ncbi:exosortase/archaeosortase family protein [Klenkia soli]|uniref:Exosortase/archaeosortase family protein n=1 Tax=Klenkia soli TaxID=1052260 RepID=A0A1H0BYC8_9ACTN|nr:exosortase/archaeosortase family protein [Klenkia soli]SDN50566.1 exosortase/archaeosortase family protein [Klenkia soli]